MTVTFNEIRKRLEEALVRALRVEALGRQLEFPKELFRAIARDPAARGEEIRSLFADRPPLALVHFDTPGIQEYVFGVERPLDIDGGSAFVADFTSEDESLDVSFYRRLAGSQAAVPASVVIYAGGGGGLLLVAAREAAGVAGSLRSILEEATRGDLRTIAVQREVWPEELSDRDAEAPAGLAAAVGRLRPASRYAATIAALADRLARERSLAVRLAPPIPPELHIDRCSACGGRTAVERGKRGDVPELLCGGCQARRQAARDDRRTKKKPQDFEDLIRDLPEDALAVIYADGANVGRAFRQVETMAQHRALSLAVDAAMTTARNRILAVCPWLEQSSPQRFQDPICGGDDLVLILPAIAAFHVVSPLIRSFENAFDLEREPLCGAFPDDGREIRRHIERFGLGVGIAVAEHHFPIQFLLGYAKELLRSAKERIRAGGEGGETVRSAVDFLVLRSGTPLSESIAETRKRHAVRPGVGGAPTLRYTRKPMSLSELEGFLDRVKLLGARVSPSQVHAVRGELGLGLRQSRSLWRYQHARASSGKGWADYREALGRDLADVDTMLWEPVEPGSDGRGGVYRTDFLDAVEIFDFLNAPHPRVEKGATP